MKTCIVCFKSKPKKKVSYKGPKCNACARKEWKKNNPEKDKNWYNSVKDSQEFKKKKSMQFKNWMSNLSEEQLEARKAYKKLKNKELHAKRKDDPEYKARRRKNVRAWQQRDGNGKFHCAKRRAAKKQATPTWADMVKIKEIYANCPNGYEVDHVVPLQGRQVSGLHVENNLTYLLKSDNKRKSNTY